MIGLNQGFLSARAVDAVTDELTQIVRYITPFDIASTLNFSCDMVRQVVSPMLKRVEGPDTDRAIEPSGQEFGDDRFEVGPLDGGFARKTLRSEGFNDQVYGLSAP